MQCEVKHSDLTNLSGMDGPKVSNLDDLSLGQRNICKQTKHNLWLGLQHVDYGSSSFSYSSDNEVMILFIHCMD